MNDAHWKKFSIFFHVLCFSSTFTMTCWCIYLFSLNEDMCQVLGKPVPQWSVPRVIFTIVSCLSSRLRYKVDKLLGDECYSSKKLQSLGFRAQRSLREMNETAF